MLAPGDLGHFLEQVVVRGGDDAGAGIGQGFEGRLGEGRALAGIRAHAHLVEHHQGPPIGALDDACQVRHVRREGGEVLADVLLVADVGEHGVEEVDARGRLGGHEQPRPREQHGER